MIDINKLEHAAALIERAIMRADTDRRTCDRCGLARDNNRIEAQAHKELTGIANRLTGWAGRLKGNQP